MSATFEVTSRTEVRRRSDRASYERATANAILDEAIVCHLGFADATGQPVVIPTTFARHGEMLYVHGSPASRMQRSLASGIPVCLTVTLIDGIVLAKSAFHHSVNYRSVVVFGTATPVTDVAAKRRILELFVDHIVPGRMADARPPNAAELKGTLVLELPLAEASVKVRTGGPVDDDEDAEWPAWTGVVEMRTAYATEEDAPAYARDYARPRRTS